jgi:drug/metabolite transporter (DMT)-like permease
MQFGSKAWVLLLLTGGCLGLQLPFGRMATAAGVPSVTWSFVISAGAALVLGGAAAAAGRLRWPDPARLRFFCLTALVSYALPNLIMFTVIPHTGAGYAGIMFTLSPICTLLFAVMLGLKRPGLLGVAGIGAGFLGALLVAVTRGGLDQPAAPGWIGLALLIPALLAAGNVYRTLDWPDGARPIELAAGSNAMSAALLAAIAVPLTGGLHLEALGAVPVLTLAQVASASAMFALFFRLQQAGGPVYLSQIGYVAAALGLAFGTLVFGEHYPLAAWTGAALIVVGVVMTTAGQ